MLTLFKKIRIKRLKKKLREVDKIKAPNIEQALDIIFLKAELKDKLNRLTICCF